MPPLSRRFALGLVLALVPAFAGEWRPVTDAELQMKTPLVDKNADAEAILWEVKVADEQSGGYLQTTRTNYLRMKIFTERGREYAKVELNYFKKMNISGIAGRTIKPDGRVVDMKRDAVFDTEVVKSKTLRLRAKTFALPDVQPGDIIEYQWLQSEADAASNYVRLPLQRDIPVETVRYLLKPVPLNFPGYGMKTWLFHVPAVPFQHLANGFTQMEYHNMPAFKEEPHMAPEDELRAWVLIYYAEDTPRKPDQYWPGVAKKQYGLYEKDIKVNGEAKKAAAEATAGAKTDEEKARAIYAWIRRNIKNVSSEANAEERKRFKENRSSTDAIKQGLGTGYDINMVFASLAGAAGMEARIALTGNRGEMFFNQTYTDPYFLRGEMVAVKVGGEWKYYDPATPDLPCGFQVWGQQGTMALITDGKNPEWTKVPLSKAGQSLEWHSARLKLDGDGGISGTVQMKYTGHLALAERGQLARKTADEREQYVIDEMKQQFTDPELSEVKWEGVEDSEAPLALSFRIQIPNYVQRTGKRMFLQPAVFQHNLAARFPTSERRYPVYFHYPWSESDEISIEVPEGYEFDHADLPPPIKAGNTMEWKVTAKISDGKKLIFQRDFQFGDDGNIVMPKESYPTLKLVFDALHEGDEHTLALKQAAR